MNKASSELARASALIDVKRYDEAISQLARILAADPAEAQAWCLLASAHLKKGTYREAAAASSHAVSLAPSQDWPYRLASTIQLKLGNITAARATANQACKVAPDKWQCYVCLAQAELATKVRLAEAEQAAATARRLAPDQPDVHYISGLVSAAQRQWKAARAYQERVLALDPSRAGALNELGRVTIHQADHAQAARHFAQAARSAPTTDMYARNLYVTIRHLVRLTISAAALASVVLLFLTTDARLSAAAVITGYSLITALSIGFGAVQLWRMPPPARTLFRTRPIMQVLGMLYGSIIAAAILAAITPPAALAIAVLLGTTLITGSLWAARAILRPQKMSLPAQETSGRVPWTP